MAEESIQKIVTINPDSLEIGTPGKGGALKVYFDAMNKEEAEQRLNNAIEIRNLALQKMAIQ